VPVSFRVDEDVLRRARERAGGGDMLAEVMRKILAHYAAGASAPGDSAAQLARVRTGLRELLEEAG
jgi:hypothetical protein